METFQFSGVLMGSWEVSPKWVGFDSNVKYIVYKPESGLYIVRHGVYLKKNEHYFTVYQLSASAEREEVFRFGGKRKGSWHLPPPCFKGEKETFYTVYEENNLYTIFCEEVKIGKEERIFSIHKFSSRTEATDSEIGKMLPLAVFV